MTAVTAAIFSLMIAWSLVRQRRAHHLQYLYFLRVPAGAVFLLLGVAATGAFGLAKEFLLNLFDLEFLGFVLVTWLAVLGGWTTMFVGFLMYNEIPARNRLCYRRRDEEAADRARTRNLVAATVTGTKGVHRNPPVRLGGRPLTLHRRLALFLLPGLAVSAGALMRSWSGDGVTNLGHLAAVALGVGAAYATRLGLVPWLERVVERVAPRLPTHPGRRPGVGPFLRSFVYAAPADPEFTHQKASALLLLLLAIFVVGGVLLDPRHRGSVAVPALAYLLYVIMFGVLVLAGITFYLDTYRVPVELVLVGGFLVNYALLNDDHRYPVAPLSAPIAALTPREVIEAWRSRNPDLTTLTVVAASGGGARAAKWTSTVICSLNAAVGADFLRSIPLISATSGGAVGSMFVVEAIRDGLADRERLHLADVAAGATSLASVTWGFVYGDLWRAFLPLAPLALHAQDRGVAMERRFDRVFVDAFGRSPSLRGWAEDVAAGRRPALVFNATVAESGRRFAIAPVVLSPPAGVPTARWRGIDNFLEQCPGVDVRMTTAGRLSATFPYVTPIARIDAPVEGAYHIADGGYSENYGVLSIIEFLDPVMEHLAETGISRVLLVEIRSSRSEEAPSDPRGWLHQAFGPVITLNNVRATSQIATNDLAWTEAARRWFREDGVQVGSALFEFAGEAALAWHLSDTDRHAIEADWSRPGLHSARERVYTWIMGGGAEEP